MKRLGIFVFFDADGYVGKYVDYLLNDIKENLNELIVVCNGKLSADGRAIMEKYADSIYIRENSGFDGTAWKVALSDMVGWDNVPRYDEIVFLNDINYGPIYPFKVVFDEMDKRSALDFWGITRHYQATDFTGYFESGILPEHIQTYFFVVRQHMLQSKNFKKFWIEMPEIKNFTDDIGLFETQFTKYFSDCGFMWDTYVDMESLKGKGVNNYSFNYDLPYVLISEYKMPLIRRKSLTQFVQNSCAGPEKDPRRVLKYVERNTDYDIALIWEDLLRKNNVADLYTRLHLDYILPTEGVLYEPLKQNRVALLLHIYYKDEIEYCFRYAQSMPDYTDVYITTIEKNTEAIKEVFSKLECNKLDIRVIKNRGRDMSALYVGCKDVLESNDYDYICCIHDKKSPQVGILFGMAFRDTTFENVLASKEFVNNVIGTLDREPFLGYLGFPYMIGGPYWPVLRNAWASPDNFNATSKLLERCCIPPKIAMDKPPILYANVFWCRPHAIKPIVDLKLTYEDFDEEPLAIDGTFSHALERVVTYVAQSQGYYSGVLYTDEYASIYIPALMLEYSCMAGAHSQAVATLSGLGINPAGLNALPQGDLSNYPSKTLLKNIGKRILKPYPRLYGFASKIWKKFRRRA